MPYLKSSDQTSLFFTEWGSGPPVVFTHAWGLRSDEWDYQIPDLADAGLRCVLYDRRGHGRSDRPASGYDFDTLADDLAAVINHLDLQDITLVGHSLGCRELVRYLTRYGDARVTRMVLVAPTTPLLRRSAGLLGRVGQGAVALRAALAVLVPLAAILVWALYLSPRSPRRLRDPAALVSELAIFGAAGAALGVSSTTALAAAFAVAAALDAVLVRVFQRPNDPH